MQTCSAAHMRKPTGAFIPRHRVFGGNEELPPIPLWREFSLSRACKHLAGPLTGQRALVARSPFSVFIPEKKREKNCLGPPLLVCCIEAPRTVPRMARHGPEPLGETKHAFKRRRSRSPARPESPKRQKNALATPPRSAVESSSAAASASRTVPRQASSALNHGGEPEEQVAAEGQVPRQDWPQTALQFTPTAAASPAPAASPAAQASVGANGPLKAAPAKHSDPGRAASRQLAARNSPASSSRVSPPYSPRRSPRQQALQSQKVAGKGGDSAARGSLPTQPPSTSPAAENQRVPDDPRCPPRSHASQALKETVQLPSACFLVLMILAVLTAWSLWRS